MRTWLVIVLLAGVAWAAQAQRTYVHGREYARTDTGWVRVQPDGSRAPVNIDPVTKIGNERYTRVDGALVWLDSYEDWWPMREDEFTARFIPDLSTSDVEAFARDHGCTAVHISRQVVHPEASRAAVLDTLPKVYAPDYLNVLLPRLVAGTTYLIQLPEGKPLLATMELFYKSPEVLEVLPSFESFD